MTQPQDPRQHPLQDDEIDLARVLRALPAGEPSSRVDAAILAAASDAVAASPGRQPRARASRRILPWLPTWAIGTAAAAVLAVGIGTQLRPPLAPTVSPQADQSEAYRPLPEARPRLQVELPEPEAAPLLLPPPSPPPTQPAQVRRPSQAPLSPPAAPLPQASYAEPAPMADADAANAFPAMSDTAESEVEAGISLDSVTVSGSRIAAPAESGDQARRRHQATHAARAEQRRQAERESLARNGQALSAAPPVAKAEAAAETQRLALPPVAGDAELALDAWFDRIRLRSERKDLAGARESLAALRQAYPDAVLPDDLESLR
ncbi:hypothetical protein [Arenimonas alkanexedens]